MCIDALSKLAHCRVESTLTTDLVYIVSVCMLRAHVTTDLVYIVSVCMLRAHVTTDLVYIVSVCHAESTCDHRSGLHCECVPC